ncbi:MAG: hypothetical protein IJ324_04095 [Lachnospiraceae bacterium]|nr:hypothetical protein [Lachnospiraceae bacterium]
MFFSAKNICALFLALVTTLMVYQYAYIPAYESVPQEEIAKIENQMNDVSFYIKKYKDMIAQYEEIEPQNESIDDLRAMLKIWEKYDSRKKMLTALWISPENDADTILLFNRQIDEMMVDAPTGMDLGIELIYDENQRDWQGRMLLHAAYEKEGWQEPVISNKPTGGYVLYDALSGKTVIFLVLVILVMFWNYDIWSFDFDNATYKLLYTLPYSKNRIFAIRCLVHWLGSLIGVLIVLSCLFVKGTSVFGTGLESFQIVNEQALTHFGGFSEEMLFLGNGDFAMKLKDAIILRLGLTMLFLTLLFCVLQFISFSVANGTSVIITFTTILLLVCSTSIMGVNLTVENEAVLSGDMGIGVPLVILIEICTAIVFLIWTNWWMHHREV